MYKITQIKEFIYINLAIKSVSSYPVHIQLLSLYLDINYISGRQVYVWLPSFNPAAGRKLGGRT